MRERKRRLRKPRRLQLRQLSSNHGCRSKPSHDHNRGFKHRRHLARHGEIHLQLLESRVEAFEENGNKLCFRHRVPEEI